MLPILINHEKSVLNYIISLNVSVNYDEVRSLEGVLYLQSTLVAFFLDFSTPNRL